MAKVKNNDLDELDFSFGGSTIKTTTKPVVKSSTQKTQAPTVPVSQPIPFSDDTDDIPTPVVNEKNFKQPQVLPEGSSDALDSRYLINSTDDITGHTMWNSMTSNGRSYSSVYQGMQVYVKSTKDIMVYMGPTTMEGVRVEDATNLNYWVTLKTTANMDKIITAVSINHKYYSIPEKDGTALNIDMAGTQVPYKNDFVTQVDVDYIRTMMNDPTIQAGDTYPDLTSIVNNIYSRITITGNDI